MGIFRWSFGVQFDLPVSQEILTEVARFDRFQGTGSLAFQVPPRLFHEAVPLQADVPHAAAVPQQLHG